MTRFADVKNRCPNQVSSGKLYILPGEVCLCGKRALHLMLLRMGKVLPVVCLWAILIP